MESRMYKYRLYPSKIQRRRLISNFIICKGAYNHLLAISKDAYKFGSVTLTKFDYDAINKGFSASRFSIDNIPNHIHLYTGIN